MIFFQETANQIFDVVTPVIKIAGTWNLFAIHNLLGTYIGNIGQSCKPFSAVKRPISQRRDTIRQFYEFLLPQAAEKAYSSAHCRYNGVPRSGARTSDFSAHVCVWWASSQFFLCSRADLLIHVVQIRKGMDGWILFVFLFLFYYVG